MSDRLTHFDEHGRAVMVDVSEKDITERIAIARGCIAVNNAAFVAIESGTAKKGDVLGIARVAGIMAAKKTGEIIPLCHPLMLTKCTVDFTLQPQSLEVEVSCTVKVSGRTGVEMEALTGATVALLTIYDMCKAVDRAMKIKNIYLVQKSGGKSGEFRHPLEQEAAR